MAVDPFNSVGGYTVGIPPIPVVNSNGNITTSSATIGNLYVSGNANIAGTVEANLFVGTFQGVVQGEYHPPGYNTYMLYNDHGTIGASAGFTFDSTTQTVNISNDLVANSITIGASSSQFVQQRVLITTSNNTVPDQVLHSQPANTICSVDYVIVATDPVANTRQTTKLFASVLGSELGYFEYGTIDVPITSPGVGDFKVAYKSGDVVLTVTPTTSNLTTYKILIVSYKE